MPLQFAFLDFETTGLEPWRDRVIEIGLVITDSFGVPLEHWLTLVNPETGDAGPTRIHLIESSWLPAAPTFKEIVGDLAIRLSNRVLVCHNSHFETGFLEKEFERAGCEFPDIPTVDTMTIANTIGLPRGLHGACREVGYLYDSHNAMDDAVACAELFHRLLPMVEDTSFTDVETVHVETRIAPTGRIATRELASEAVKPRSVLDDLTRHLYPHEHSSNDAADSDTYKQIVVEALADGYIDPDERYEMASTGHRLRLSEDTIRDIHLDVISAMIETALEDNRMSPAERTEIERAAIWLDVDLGEWDSYVKAARKRVKQRKKDFADSLEGKVVTFTGAGVHPWNVREALALKHGMKPTKSISSKTQLLVIGREELDTKTVQEARAREVMVIVESSFWRNLGEL